MKVFDFAMKLEAGSFRLYEDAATKEAGTEIRGLLLKVAEEERKHFPPILQGAQQGLRERVVSADARATDRGGHLSPMTPLRQQ